MRRKWRENEKKMRKKEEKWEEMAKDTVFCVKKKSVFHSPCLTWYCGLANYEGHSRRLCCFRGWLRKRCSACHAWSGSAPMSTNQKKVFKKLKKVGKKSEQKWQKITNFQCKTGGECVCNIFLIFLSLFHHFFFTFLIGALPLQPCTRKV